ncbi:hypothetical protein OH460_08630 [Vibrio sp. Makdt]|uniref:hypothetical protein n=1 Tax=Vibrio sp. Makdt TaxID=2998828 RepID=UPI0022CD72B9|nr:hypothetical protein [Vibrio sp. Makdt]MDA0152366.1 hypothetical protein [Vibrio sp. Makdt]
MAYEWKSIKDKEPPSDVPVMCKLQHWFTEGVQEYEMIRVESSDHSWITADDRSELDFNWNVIEWLETPEISALSD